VEAPMTATLLGLKMGVRLARMSMGPPEDQA
jgi:hypothetical protein